MILLTLALIAGAAVGISLVVWGINEEYTRPRRIQGIRKTGVQTRREIDRASEELLQTAYQLTRRRTYR